MRAMAIALILFLFLLTLCTTNLMAATKPKVLIILTSHNTLGSTGRPTGYYLEELANPLFSLIDAGYEFDIASPSGGEAPMDPHSRKPELAVNKRFLENADLMRRVRHTMKLTDIRHPGEYGAVIYPGGHGPMFDLAGDAGSQKIAAAIYEHGGVVAAVCHGPAAIANVKLADGKYLINGKHVTGFSNAEEAAAGLTKEMPFLLEDQLKANGGIYESAPVWEEKVVVDGRLITGQNPKSAPEFGRAIVSALGVKKQAQ